MSELPEVETVLEILDSAKLHISRIGMEMAREAVHILAQRLAEAEEFNDGLRETVGELEEEAIALRTRAERAEAALREIEAFDEAHLPTAAHVDEALARASDIARTYFAATPTEEPEHG